MIDPSLSDRANGLLARLQKTLTPGARIDTMALVRPQHREGRDAIRAVLRELAAAGYVSIDRIPEARGRWSTATRFTPPTGNPQARPEPENPFPVNTNHHVTPKTEKAFPEQARVPSPQVTPEPGFQGPATPSPEPPSQGPEPFPQVTPKTEIPVISTSVVTTREKTNYKSAAAHTSTPAHTRPRGTVTPAELNATASRPAAYSLVADWHNTLTVKLRPTVLRALTKTADTLLRDRADPDILRTALNDWATRGKTPEFLPYCYDDAARTARAEAARTGPEMPAREAPKLSKRSRKAFGYLAPDDPLRAQLGLPQGPASGSEPELPNVFQPRVIEGGRSA